MRSYSLFAAAALTLSACARNHPEKSTLPQVKGDVKSAFALQYIDVMPGTGRMVGPKTCVFVHYTGYLTNGTKFDSSRDTMPNGQRRTPISFPQGSRRVIAGWDLGFEGMQVGAQRRLIIPYQLAYGELGRPPAIPPKSTLVFDVELMAVADTLPRNAGAPTQPGPSVPQCPTWEVVAVNR
ncbi:MAG: peptidylprolyl isomerase FKBP-type [Gemmatimonadetes bacterium]|nr:peptidylprolyl isomerase FKBP-type [Gemmatimonadota bacterium]